MTGWGLADEVLLAGTLPDGRSAWVVAPLVEGETLRASPPMRLCAMNASATVSLSCRRLRIEAERHVKAMTPEELEGDTAGAILFFTALSLGVARAAVELLRAGDPDGPLAGAAIALDRELAAARAAVNRWDDPATPVSWRGDVAALRAWCIDLGVRAAHAAVAGEWRGGESAGPPRPAALPGGDGLHARRPDAGPARGDVGSRGPPWRPRSGMTRRRGAVYGAGPYPPCTIPQAKSLADDHRAESKWAGEVEAGFSGKLHEYAISQPPR